MKTVLDVACGGKMFYYNKNDPRVEFCDKRKVDKYEICQGNHFEVNPDTVCDFTNLPFDDASYNLVVFDPPHLEWAGEKSWLAAKYGRLEGDWREMLRQGFAECFRVLKPGGTLIFKWSEVQIPLREILALTPEKPIFGHRSGKNMNTHWCCFAKEENHDQT